MISQSSNQECHAVLASLSERYPPLKGRSPTRYSPVRHSTQDRSPFRVRLACVRHAASVDSEPGSNSQVKVFVLRAPCGNPLGICSTREACRLFCLLRLVSACRRRRLRADSSRPADTLTGWFVAPLSLPQPRRPRPSRRKRGKKSCVHALSSFQRTEAENACSSRVSCVAVVAATVVRRTFQDYVGSEHPVNKNFQVFCRQARAKALVVEPSLSKNRRRLLPSRRSERAHRLQAETTCLTEIQIVTI